jgi:hypothetical protein
VKQLERASESDIDILLFRFLFADFNRADALTTTYFKETGEGRIIWVSALSKLCVYEG